MVRYNKQRNNYFDQTRTVYNNYHEANISPLRLKTFYATMGNSLVTYEGVFRSEAKRYFEEVARLNGEKLDSYIGTFK